MSTEEKVDLIQLRKDKLARLKAAGIDPFKNDFFPVESASSIRANPTEGREVRAAGRLSSRRDMGKSMFCDIRDESDRLQIYVQKNVVGEDLFKIFSDLDLGDIIGVEGELFVTKTGELSIKVARYTILSKALRPPPEKWHGLQDVETRYRQRYLDLMGNPEVRDIFRSRSLIIQEIRNFLYEKGYLEVETPMMQSVAGGAAARPFVTQHEALGCKFYLRIAIELYLKRLLVGGFEKIFEINRNFRNEGISRRHNPEFTMMELYQAYGNYETMMELIQEMIPSISRKILGTTDIKHPSPEGAPEKIIHLQAPWERKTFYELLGNAVAPDFRGWSGDRKRETALKMGIKDVGSMEVFEVENQIFEKIIQPALIQPIFVTHLPKQLVPLAKISKDDPDTVEVFELCINGMEVAPAYTEQNDPIEQRERFQEQVGQDIQNMDEDFLIAMEHGMPPAGGMGLGIDRLIMTLTGQESIRDVILFPQLKPQSNS